MAGGWALDRTWWPAKPQAVDSEKYKSATHAQLVDSIGATIPEISGTTPGAGKKGGA